MREYINVLEHSEEITKALKSGGILLNTMRDGKFNTMTMGWAFIGQMWESPYIISFVRAPRFTREALEETGRFTISVPGPKTDKRILGYCGSRSGRDTDKAKDLSLTLCEAEVNGVPGIKELPLTIECEVTYKQTQIPQALPEEIRTGIYSDNEFHTMYFGKVLKAYIIK